MARNYRYKKWDYKGCGFYMITLNVEGRKPLLGTLRVERDEPWIDYSPLGKAVSSQIEECFAGYSQIQICAKQLMPDHLHFVVWVKDRIPISLGEIIRRLKIGCTHAYWEIVLRINAQSINAISIENGETAEEKDRTGAINEENINRPSLFERGFHDRILLHAGQLRSKIDYVHSNPRRLALRRANPHLFIIHQDVKWGQLRFTTLGNMFLLDFPLKGVVQCSRSLTQPDIDKIKEDCLYKAEHGVVFVSACISEGEKQISRALREAGYPMIVLLNDGFPEPDSPHYKYFKPQGVYFEACAAGKLLLIEPQTKCYTQKDEPFALEKDLFANYGGWANLTTNFTRKVIIDGQLIIILPDGRKFNAIGKEIR